MLPVLNPKSYDGARVLEASGRPILVIGCSKRVVIQLLGDNAGTIATGTKSAGKMTGTKALTGTTGVTGTGLKKS